MQQPDLAILKQKKAQKACHLFARPDIPQIVVSPYRFNPLGAHVDHQGGAVMARTIDQYTLLPFWTNPDNPIVSLQTDRTDWPETKAEFRIGETDSDQNWIRYAQAAMAVLNDAYPIRNGITAAVSGTMIGAGLSSSSSVILSYLSALASANAIQLSSLELIEFARRVENDYMGLNNGIQDQMSIVYGSRDSLSLLDVQSATATQIADPPQVDEISWVVCYSGFSRELINSNFNTRVSECRQAATTLDPAATILSEVGKLTPDDDRLKALSPALANRARHFFSETERVRLGALTWANAEWRQFGELMNESCNSSINQYECGSQPLIDLFEITRQLDGVYGSRFSGGGYGGCLIALCDSALAGTVVENLKRDYCSKYPEKKSIASIFIALPEDGVRVELVN